MAEGQTHCKMKSLAASLGWASSCVLHTKNTHTWFVSRSLNQTDTRKRRHPTFAKCHPHSRSILSAFLCHRDLHFPWQQYFRSREAALLLQEPPKTTHREASAPSAPEGGELTLPSCSSPLLFPLHLLHDGGSRTRSSL